MKNNKTYEKCSILKEVPVKYSDGCDFNYDLEKMKEVLASPVTGVITSGMSKDEI